MRYKNKRCFSTSYFFCPWRDDLFFVRMSTPSRMACATLFRMACATLCPALARIAPHTCAWSKISRLPTLAGTAPPGRSFFLLGHKDCYVYSHKLPLPGRSSFLLGHKVFIYSSIIVPFGKLQPSRDATAFINS